MMMKGLLLLLAAAASPVAGRIQQRRAQTPEPLTELPVLTLPPGGLRACNEPIPSDFPDNIITKEVILAILQGIIDALELGELGDTLSSQMESIVQYDVRAHKICTSCEEANELFESTNNALASETMPYCAAGSFAAGRTMSGLLLEPIDPDTKEPIVGKVPATIYNFSTEPNPFLAPTETWPANVAQSPPQTVTALATSSAGTYTIIPDVIGNGEDWEGIRSYVVAAVYQASAVPLLLKTQDMLEKEYTCTELDKRVAIMGFSEAGYATTAIAHAVDMLMDGWVHTYTAVAGAPVKMSTELKMNIVDMYENTYTFPMFAARLGNAYSSTNVDLVNTGASSEFANDEYLDSTDPLKDVREWAKAGIGYEEMAMLMPGPPASEGRQSDIMNEEYVDMVVSSFEDGDNDPCNSEFKTEGVNSLCEAIMENDLIDILESFDYPVVICHSPEDEIIPYENVPNTTEYAHLTLIEDIVPSLQPSGTHAESGAQCTMSFLFPFMDPTSDVRTIEPLDDPDGSCVSAVTTTGSTIAGATTTAATIAGATTTAATPDAIETPSPTPKPTEGPTSSAVAASAVNVAVTLFVTASVVVAW
ncbi:hypothetical protein ACHAXT_006071 [Thalassiosira profunda]